MENLYSPTSRVLQRAYYTALTILFCTFLIAGITNYFFPDIWYGIYIIYSLPFSYIKISGLLEFFMSMWLLRAQNRLLALYLMFLWSVAAVWFVLHAHLWLLSLFTLPLFFLSAFSLWAYYSIRKPEIPVAIN